jgi:hypothetical protein
MRSIRIGPDGKIVTPSPPAPPWNYHRRGIPYGDEDIADAWADYLGGTTRSTPASEVTFTPPVHDEATFKKYLERYSHFQPGDWVVRADSSTFQKVLYDLAYILHREEDMAKVDWPKWQECPGFLVATSVNVVNPINPQSFHVRWLEADKFRLISDAEFQRLVEKSDVNVQLPDRLDAAKATFAAGGYANKLHIRRY